MTDLILRIDWQQTDLMLQAYKLLHGGDLPSSDWGLELMARDLVIERCRQIIDENKMVEDMAQCRVEEFVDTDRVRLRDMASKYRREASE